MPNEQEAELRKQIVQLLEGGEAHLKVAAAVKDLPVLQADKKPGGAPHSAWQLLEHLRITQGDILQFSLGENYKPLKWPDEYWPATEAPPSEAAWKESIERFDRDQKALMQLAQDPNRDLYAPFPHGEGQNLLRELLVVADHNSHHLGQLIYLKKMLAQK